MAQTLGAEDARESCALQIGTVNEFEKKEKRLKEGDEYIGLAQSSALPSHPAQKHQSEPAESEVDSDSVVVIEPTRSWTALKLREIWTYRELLYFLIWRDLKVRYKQTVLGALWAVVQPLLMTIVFSVFLGKLVRVPSPGIPYPLLVFSGFLPWIFFSTAVGSSGNSLVGNAHLITKVYFPRMIIPLAAVGARVVDFAISFLILGGMMVYYRVGVTWKLAMLPIFLILIICITTSIGMLSSAWNVKYRDVGVILPVIIQVWMFASPVVYPLELVPEAWRTVYALNPLVGIIGGFRASLFGGNLDGRAVIFSAAVTLCLMIYSAYSFRRMEKTFADLV